MIESPEPACRAHLFVWRFQDVPRSPVGVNKVVLSNFSQSHVMLQESCRNDHPLRPRVLRASQRHDILGQTNVHFELNLYLFISFIAQLRFLVNAYVRTAMLHAELPSFDNRTSRYSNQRRPRSALQKKRRPLCNIGPSRATYQREHRTARGACCGAGTRMQASWMCAAGH